MAKNNELPFERLMRMSGGDMDTMRRIEQFGPDILQQYGGQQQMPQELPGGNPMMQMPTPVAVSDEYADLQLPPTVADPRSTPIYDDTNWPYEGGPVAKSAPAKKASPRTVQDEPTGTLGRGGPVTPKEVAGFYGGGDDYAMMDAVLEAQSPMPKQSVAPQSSSVPANEDYSSLDALLAASGAGGAAAAYTGAKVVGNNRQAKAEKAQAADARMNAEYGPRPQQDIINERTAAEYGPNKAPPSSQGSVEGLKQDPFDQFVANSSSVQQAPQAQPEGVKQDEIRPYTSKTIAGMAVERERVLMEAGQQFAQMLDKVPGYEGQGSTFVNQLQQALMSKDEKQVVQMLTSLPTEQRAAFFQIAQRLHNQDPGIGLERLLAGRAMMDDVAFAKRSLGNSLRVFK